MFKGVIFDMDGVLIDSHPIHKRSWKKFLKSLGKEVTDDDLQFILDGRKKEDILRYFLGDLPSAAIKDYGHRKEAIFRAEASNISVIPGILELVFNLHAAGVLLAVASSGSKSRVHYILDRTGLARYFATVVTGDDVQRGKPDPTIFLVAAERLNCASSDVLVVEDAVAGVIAAKSAGMRCLAVASNGRAAVLRSAGADSVVTNIIGLDLRALHAELLGQSAVATVPGGQAAAGI